jgi:CRP-like cAMP-binding protein
MKKTRQFREIAVNHNEKTATLKKSRICIGMNFEEVQALAPFITPFHLDSGTDVYEEGDTEAFLCLIISGAVKSYKSYGLPTQRTLAELGVGETVGEMAVIDEQVRSASAIAITESILYAFTRKNMLEYNKIQPLAWGKLMHNIAVMLCKRLRRANDMIIEGGLTIDDANKITPD